MARVIDPVCGMEFEESVAAAQSACLNRTFHFCHPMCKKIFEANPERFVYSDKPKILKPKFTRDDVTPAA